MSTILAIDPGNTESGWVLIDTTTRAPLTHGITPNPELRSRLRRMAFAIDPPDQVVIEMVASYGMAVGAEVFETCVWIGRFLETCIEAHPSLFPQRIKRLAVKVHHCHDSRAKDTNIRQALVDRFASGQPNHGKGTTAAPGWFHGFTKDVWAAYALAVYAADQAQPVVTMEGV